MTLPMVFRVLLMLARGLASGLLAAGLCAQEVPSAELDGLATDALQRPLAAGEVTVEVEGEVVARTRSDAAGAFHFERVPQAQAVVRVVSGPDVGAVAVDLAGIDRGFARVPVWPARTLRGVVRREDGKPAAGAWVMAAPSGSRQLAVIDACAQAGADGRYELTHVLVGPVTVRAWSPDCDAFEGAAEGADDVTLDCELGCGQQQEIVFALRSATPAQLQQTVLRLVSLRGAGQSLPPPLRVMRPAADGSCVVRGLWREQALVGRFLVPGATVIPAFDKPPNGVNQWRCEFEVETLAECGITGALRDGDGEPLADRLLLCRSFDDEYAAIATVFGRTQADGTFALPSPVPWRDLFALRVLDPQLAVVHDDSLALGARSWFVARHEFGAEREVPTATVATLRLTVVDAAGTPVDGAEVTVRDETGRGGGPVVGLGSSDAAGLVEMPGIDRRGLEQVRIQVRAPSGWAESRCTLDPERPGVLGALALVPAATLRGRVLMETGKGVVGARVKLGPYDEVVLTDRNGEFVIAGQRRGTYGCSASAGRLTWETRRPVELRDGETTELVLKRLY